MFRDKRTIIGRNAIRVPTIAIKVLTSEVPMNKNEITNAAIAKAIPTP